MIPNRLVVSKREKMSKSRNNVITPDEVIYGVVTLAPGFEFRDKLGNVFDYAKWRIWRDKGHDSFYYTSTQTGKIPVFLCEIDNPFPCILLINNEEVEQHPTLC